MDFDTLAAKDSTESAAAALKLKSSFRKKNTGSETMTIYLDFTHFSNAGEGGRGVQLVEKKGCGQSKCR